MTARTFLPVIGVSAAMFAGCGGGDSGPHVGAIIRLTPAGANYGVVAARDGHAAIVATPDTGAATLTLRSRTGPSQWSNPTLVAAPGFQAMGVSLGLDDSGRPTVGWVARHLSTTASQITTRNPHGTWPRPTSIPPVGRTGLAPFEIGVTGHGDAISVWDPEIGQVPAQVTATVHRADGTWTPAHLLERTTTPRLPAQTILVPHSDSGTVVWQRDETAGRQFHSTLHAARWSEGGGWQATRTLPTTGRVVALADAKPLAGGRTLIAWTALENGTENLHVATLGPDGSFTQLGAIRIGQDQSPNTPQLATATDGSAAVLVPRWTAGNAPADLALVRITPDGQLGTPQVLDQASAPQARKAPPAPNPAIRSRTSHLWGAGLTLADDGTVTAAWATSPTRAAARPGTTRMTIATIPLTGTTQSTQEHLQTDGGGIAETRVDQLGSGVALVTWRLTVKGRLAGTYGVEVSP
ncbi:MAG: hypothetical protein U0Y82_00555 [Thermoleophilia bacterium]